MREGRGVGEARREYETECEEEQEGGLQRDGVCGKEDVMKAWGCVRWPRQKRDGREGWRLPEGRAGGEKRKEEQECGLRG